MLLDKDNKIHFFGLLPVRVYLVLRLISFQSEFVIYRMGRGGGNLLLYFSIAFYI